MSSPTTLVRSVVFAAIATVSICSSASTSFARPVRIWSETELWDQADVVILGKAKSTKDVNPAPANPPPAETWVSVSTTFEIQAVLKGKPGDKTLEVRHHRYQAKEGETIVIDGPSFVEFTPGKHQYMIFLKAEKVDDTVYYEPLTGQYDPDGSFVRLERYHVTHEREKPAAADEPATDAPSAKAKNDKPTVTDAKSEITFTVQADDRTITATDKDGKALWSVDVIKTAGAPDKSAPLVRHLSISKDRQLTAVYGKHHFATFELKSGKLLSVASD